MIRSCRGNAFVHVSRNIFTHGLGTPGVNVGSIEFFINRLQITAR
jgi:hypothetical protein